MIRKDLTSDTVNLNQLVMIPLPQLFDRAAVMVESEADSGNEAGGMEARTGVKAVVTVRIGSSSRTHYHVRDPIAADVESLPQVLVDRVVQGETGLLRPCPQLVPSRPPRWGVATENICTRRTRLKVA